MGHPVSGCCLCQCRAEEQVGWGGGVVPSITSWWSGIMMGRRLVALFGLGLISSHTVVGSTSMSLSLLTALVLPVCSCHIYTAGPLVRVMVHCGSHREVMASQLVTFSTTLSPTFNSVVLALLNKATMFRSPVISDMLLG